MSYLSSIATLTGYLAVFLFSVLLARAYENSLARGQLDSRFVRFLARTLVILFPVLMIGLRDMSVGYDTQQMTRLLFSGQYPVDELLRTQHDPFSIIASTLLYPLCFGNTSLYLCVVSYATLYCFLLGAEQWRDRVSIAYSLLVYYMYFALLGMDQFKQLLALSIVFIAFGKLKNNRIKSFFVITTIAGLFHSTAFLGYLMYLFNIRGSNRKPIVAVTLIALVLAGFNTNVLFTAAAAVFGEGTYSSYFNGELFLRSSSSEGSGLGFILHLAPCIFPLFFYRSIPASIRWFVLLPLVATFPLRMMGYESQFLFRLYYTPAIMLTVAIPLISRTRKPLNGCSGFDIASISILLVYYYITFSTSHGVSQYSFAI